MIASKKQFAWRMLACALGALLLLTAHLPEVMAQEQLQVPLGRDRSETIKYANGVKKMMVVRIEPQGKPGKPIPEAKIRAAMKEVNKFFVENSGGKLSFVVTVGPVVPIKDISSDESVLEAVEAAGIDFSKYDMTVWIGDDGEGGGMWGSWKKGQWPTTSLVIHGFDPSLIIFAMAQTGFDLPDGAGWMSQNENPIGAGESVIERNRFDASAMGDGDFGTRAKNYLGWLPDSDVQTITKSGVYRVAAHDQPNSTGTRALQIAKDEDTLYWIEFRQRSTNVPWAMNGALMLWTDKNRPGTELLDMTPGSIGEAESHLLGYDEDCSCMDVVDAPLVVGRTFSDRERGIHITTLRKVTVNGSDGKPLKALDIAVNLGQFPNNRPPKLSIKASAQTVKAGQKVTFKATADDADGDAISYYWDFGDLSFSGGNATTSHAWEEEREYVVRCTASDARGGTAFSSLVIKVGAPQTARLTGRVLIDGKPLANAMVRVVPATPPTPAKAPAPEDDEESMPPFINRVFTDSDGTYTLVNLPSKSVPIRARLEGYAITASGMSTHADEAVEIVASKTPRLDFTAVRQAIAPQTAAPVTAPPSPVAANVPMTPPATAPVAPARPTVVTPVVPPTNTRPAATAPVSPAPTVPATAAPAAPPVVLIVSIDRPQGRLQAMPKLSGVASSLPAGRVKGVNVSIRRDSDNFYWDGKSWIEEFAELPAALSSGKWTLSRSLPTTGDGVEAGTYTIKATAVGDKGARSPAPDPKGEPPIRLNGTTGGIVAPRIGGLDNGNTPLTVEMWIYPTDFPPPGGLGGLMRLGGGGSGIFWHIRSWQGENIHKASLEMAGVNARNLDLPLNTWTHLASTYDGKNLKLYINGKQVAQADANFLNLQETRLFAGLMTDDPTNNIRFEGGIGQTRVWNRARTAEEIERDMYERLTGQEDGLVLLWRMEDGAGKTARDATGNGNDGQILEGTTWSPLSLIQIKINPAKP